MFVQIIGKHIRKEMKIGTWFDWNQINAIIIKLITGVERTKVIIGRIKSKNHFLKPQRRPRIIPKILAMIKPINTLDTVLNIERKKLLFLNNSTKAFIVTMGDGKYNTWLIIFDIINQTINQNSNGSIFLK